MAQRALDRKLTAWRELPTSSTARPTGGWIRAIRDGLGMSAAELAERLEVSQASVTKLEASERAGRARLDTLERAANALNCDLVYAVVPRHPLHDLVRSQAERILTRELATVENSMRLEDQGVSDDDADDAHANLIEQISNERGLWRDA